jgi:hypothetical protein
MAKRFIETTIWTGNKWFRKLEPKFKLLWFYLISTCDPVGVWEEDLELASFIISFEFEHESVLKIFKDKLKIINNGKKWWIIDFCNFQYGELKEDNIKNRPHQSYISLLKKHSLWIDYTKSLQRLKDKEKDKDKEEDKEKDKETEIYKRIIDGFYQYHNKQYKFDGKERGTAKRIAALLVKQENWEAILKAKVNGLLKKTKENPKFWAFTIPKLEHGWNEFPNIQLEEEKIDLEFINNLDLRNEK